MIETDEQRRWWFATHPEYSWSHIGEKERARPDSLVLAASKPRNWRTSRVAVKEVECGRKKNWRESVEQASSLTMFVGITILRSPIGPILQQTREWCTRYAAEQAVTLIHMGEIGGIQKNENWTLRKNFDSAVRPTGNFY